MSRCEIFCCFFSLSQIKAAAANEISTTEITKDSNRTCSTWALHICMQAFLWKINLWNLSPRRRKKAVTCTHFTTLSHIACNQEQIDWRKKVNCVRSSTSSLGCRDEKKKPTREKNIFRDTCLFWKNGIWCYCTQRCLSIRKHWGVCEFLAGVYVCLLYFVCWLVCVSVCVFFTFYRCFAEYEKSKYCTTAISSLHIWSIGWLVGCLAGWFVVVSMYFSFVHISFVFIIYFHIVYTEKTNI